jgi:protein TonB
MPLASSASAIRRRNVVSLAASAAGHALLLGLGAILVSRPLGTPPIAGKVVVELVDAKPDPFRAVALAPPNEPPAAPTPLAPRSPRSRPNSQPRVPRGAPAALRPSLEPATASDGALPVSVEAAPRKDEGIPGSSLTSSPTAPIASAPGPITVLATPRYRSNPSPDYPIVSKRRHEEGSVQVNVTVSSDGRPLHVSLLKSSGYSLLDQAAIEAVRTWVFEPARASGIAVTSEVVVPVRFSLSRE